MENQWQPIETAPKDGSKFLMFITGMEYKKNNDDKKYKAKTIQKVLIADYCLKSNCFYGEDNFFGIVKIDGFNFKKKGNPLSCIKDIQATHWMPLPKPPVINN